MLEIELALHILGMTPGNILRLKLLEMMWGSCCQGCEQGGKHRRSRGGFQGVPGEQCPSWEEINCWSLHENPTRRAQ